MSGPGRPPSTGRYDTREELVTAVWDLWRGTPHTVTAIARMTGASAAVVNKIIDRAEGLAEYQKRNRGN